MKKKHVSQEFNFGDIGHNNYNFVDVAVNDDNKLFIDPCLIEFSDDEWTKNANIVMMSFFNKLFEAYNKQDDSLITELLSHAGEQNGTRFGYGKGYNGKGNTADGLMQIFHPLKELIKDITTISKPEDLPLLLPGFAEDGMSDLLTNILHEQLNKYTVDVFDSYGVASEKELSFYTWNVSEERWEKVTKPSIFVKNKELLLVPKNIVRKKYLFGTGQYFSRIILERMIDEGGYRDSKGKAIPKKDIVKAKRYSGKHWQYDEVINYSKKNNDSLEEYHRKLPGFYLDIGKSMSDEALDDAVYGVVKNRGNN